MIGNLLNLLTGSLRALRQGEPQYTPVQLGYDAAVIDRL
jgi:hypothetical protein